MQMLITLYTIRCMRPRKCLKFSDFCRFFDKLLITFYKCLFFIHSDNKIVHNFLLINGLFFAENGIF